MFMTDLKLVTVELKGGGFEIVPEEEKVMVLARQKLAALKPAIRDAFYECADAAGHAAREIWDTSFDVEYVDDADGTQRLVATYYGRAVGIDLYLYQPLTDAFELDGDPSFHVKKREYKFTGGRWESYGK